MGLTIHFDPLQQSDSFGIDIYLSCLEVMELFDV